MFESAGIAKNSTVPNCRKRPGSLPGSFASLRNKQKRENQHKSQFPSRWEGVKEWRKEKEGMRILFVKNKWINNIVRLEKA